MVGWYMMTLLEEALEHVDKSHRRRIGRYMGR